MRPPFPEGTITSFSPTTPHYYLSNFYPCVIPYEGITYPSTEHAYQASKVQDTITRMLVMRQPTANQAKRTGGMLKLRLDWEIFKYQIMLDLLRIKFAKDSVLAAKLRFTANVHIIEGNHWHDLIWGQCTCRRHAWEGENHLGIMLMEVRHELASRSTSQGRI